MGDVEAARWGRVRDGDETALAELFDAHADRVFRHACRIVGQREDAKDAVVMAFHVLWRKRRTVRLVDGSPLPWLLAATTRVSLNLERSARRQRSLLDRIPAAEPASSPDLDDTPVIEAVRRLPSAQREIVVLTVLEGYRHDEIAQALGISVGTVKSRLSRAKHALRGQLADMEV
jgi:RNA polymerase sigma-70 factor (ECF subfamily)